MIAASLANMAVGRNWESNRENSPDAKSNKQAGDQLNVSDHSVKTAKNLKRDAPDLAEKVSRGRARKSKTNVTNVTIEPSQEDHAEAPEKRCKSS
tara:strand:- start:109 stop:393 length:285 start_codon:yes stop_codon:yes gene_type:complete